MSADEQAIRDAIRRWMEATRRNDMDAVLGLMTDDVVFLRAGRPPMVGKRTFANAAAPAEGGPTFDGKSEVQEVEICGDRAYVWTKLTVTASMPSGERDVRSGHTLSVFRKEGGRWLLSRDANMLAPVAQPSRAG